MQQSILIPTGDSIDNAGARKLFYDDLAGTFSDQSESPVSTETVEEYILYRLFYLFCQSKNYEQAPILSIAVTTDGKTEVGHIYMNSDKEILSVTNKPIPEIIIPILHWVDKIETYLKRFLLSTKKLPVKAAQATEEEQEEIEQE